MQTAVESYDQNRLTERVPLGRTGMMVSPMGLGTWQFGDSFFWSYGKTHDDGDLRQAFQISLEAGINLYDSAEVYGLGYSEHFLGKLVREQPENVQRDLVLTSKFFPFPYRVWKAHFRRALRGSLRRLGVKKVDLYQIHWAFPPRRVETWAECMADAVAAGMIRSAGVSNYNLRQTQRSWSTLKGRGVSLASNQVEFNLLRRKVEKNGLLSWCRDHEVTLIGYSPLAQGVLTGKYNPQHLPSGFRRGIYRRDLLVRVQPLIQLMREVGQGHGDRSPAQVALNWVMCKGAVAIPGAKNSRQARENAGALGWKLTPEEVLALDQASDKALA